MSFPQLELPPNLDPEKLPDVLNDRFRDLQEAVRHFVQNPATDDVALGFNRIVNLADPKDDLDGVNLRTLRRLSGAAGPAVIPKEDTGVPGIATFTVRREAYAQLTMNDLQVAAGARQVRQINFVAPSVDEVDTGWRGNGSLDGHTNPAKLVPVISGASRFGVTFKAGDYFVWNDPGAYECCRITDIDAKTGEWTVDRALFGSAIAAHTESTFYRLEPRLHEEPARVGLLGAEVPTTASGIKSKFEWPLPCKMVAAVVSQGVGPGGGGPAFIRNLGDGTYAGAPGLRTLDGYEYLLPMSGALSRGQVADFRIRASANETIRCVYGDLMTAGVGETSGAAVVILVCYIAPDGTVGLVDKLTWAGGAKASFPTLDPPRGRQMPYHSATGAGITWQPPRATQHDWPPNVLPVLDSAIFAGKLDLDHGIAINVEANVLIGQDGQWDAIVYQVGTGTAGSDCLIGIQT